MRQIADNAGVDGAVVIDHVKRLKPGDGYNAATGEYGNMIAFGIVDPAKVSRSAIQNAASIAALVLTTEAVVATKPESTPPMSGGMPGMGGMGGGMMGM